MIALLLALALQTLPDAPATMPAPVLEPEERLESRLDALRRAEEAEAADIAQEVLALWADADSATIDLLMERGEEALMAGETDLAARMFDHVTRLAPDFAEGWLRAAQIAHARQDWDYSLEALNRALTLEPRRFDAYYLLGRTLEQAERPEAALEAYEQALEIYPEYELAGQSAARIRARLRGRTL